MSITVMIWLTFLFLGYHDMFSSMSMSSTHSSASSAERATSLDFLDWDLPRIPEEATEKLNSMFILKTVVQDEQIILKAVDSHPRQMNGFLTGCLLQVSKLTHQPVLALMGRGSWMLLEGWVLNQPAPSRSPRIIVKNRKKLFDFIELYNELGKVNKFETSSTIF